MDAATQARFPVELWSERLDALYTSAAEMHYSCKPDAAAERQYNRTLKLDPMAIEVGFCCFMLSLLLFRQRLHQALLSVRGVAKSQPRWALIAPRETSCKGGFTNAKTHSWGLRTLLSVRQWCYQPPWT